MFNNSLRGFLAIVSLSFCAALIVWLVLYGKSENSLHVSALSWAWFSFLGILISAGIIEASGPAIEAWSGSLAKK